jgi:hypothetical protein
LNDTHHLNSYTKDETEKIAFEWQSLLVSAAKGGEPSTYVIEPGVILWSVQVQLLPPLPFIPSPISSSPVIPTLAYFLSSFDFCQHQRLWFISSPQDGAKGYDIIEFCFLRPEFFEVCVPFCCLSSPRPPRPPQALTSNQSNLLKLHSSFISYLTSPHFPDGVGEPKVQVAPAAPPPLALRFLPHACSRPGVPFMNPNIAAALGGGLGKKPDDDDDDDD